MSAEVSNVRTVAVGAALFLLVSAIASAAVPCGARVRLRLRPGRGVAVSGVGTVTLTEFLLARIAEDEAVARAASPAPWQYGAVESVAGGSLYDATRMIGAMHYEQRTDHDGSIVRHLLSDEANANGEHIARHDPERVLAECEAKRRIVELHAPFHECTGMSEWVERGDCPTIRALSEVYADHPDYRDEWRP